VRDGLIALSPEGVSRFQQISFDLPVLGFTFLIASLTTVLFGLWPAWQASHTDVQLALKEGSSGAGDSRSAKRARDWLVISEIALTLTLLVAAALVLKSFSRMQSLQLGYEPRGLITARMDLPFRIYTTREKMGAFANLLLEKVRALPGVQSVGIGSNSPLMGGWQTGFYREGIAIPTPSQMPDANLECVAGDYFATFKVPLQRGRTFNAGDTANSPRVIVIDQALAEQYFPGEDPLGKHISVPEFHQPMTVIGVVGDVKHRTATEPSQPQLYLAHYQLPMTFSSLVARTAVPPESLAAPIRRAVWTVDKDQPMWSVAPLERIVENSRGSTRFLAQLLAAFAGMAVLLAAVGIYGVMSYAVTERTHEIGIRMALGASGQRVRREIVARGFKMTAIALAIGVPGAVALGGAARAVLFGIGPGDPATLAAAGGLLALVSLAACYLPARRASRVDPVVALAQE
jgi:putative ABC transport system permease protein